MPRPQARAGVSAVAAPQARGRGPKRSLHPDGRDTAPPLQAVSYDPGGDRDLGVVAGGGDEGLAPPGRGPFGGPIQRKP